MLDDIGGMATGWLIAALALGIAELVVPGVFLIFLAVAAAITAAASVAVLSGIAVLLGAIAAARAARSYDAVLLKVLGATRRQVLAAQAIEYALLVGAVGVVATILGVGGGWFVVTQIFAFDWLPDWGVVAATLALGAGVTMAIGVAGSLPVLRARPAAALRRM